MKRLSRKVFALTEAFQEFFRAEASSGILLMISAALAMAWANSPWASSYFHLWEIEFGIPSKFSKTLHHWINDGLMSIFFFVVGLEIKRELVSGELASAKKAALPVLAAAGGMILPALVYVLMNRGGPGMSGWGIPMATDIAFSLGILAILGSRVPLALRIFLSAFAIVDDLGAVLVIALFYTAQINWISLGGGLFVVCILLLLNRLRIQAVAAYMLLGIILWVLVLKSGVHATIAGVILALCIPSSLNRLEHHLHPWVAFLVIPVFAMANAGVSLQGANWTLLTHPVFLGITLGLVLGKQIGVVLFSWIGVKTRVAELPESVNWKHIHAPGGSAESASPCRCSLRPWHSRIRFSLPLPNWRSSLHP